jgi:hypothetical protein
VRLAALVLVLASFPGCRCNASSESGNPTDASADAGGSVTDAASDASSADAEAAFEYTFPALVVDDTAAYWFADVRNVMTQKPSGEGAPVVFARAKNSPKLLALDSRRVYWIEPVEEDAPFGDGHIVAAARSDGSRQVLATLSKPRGLVVDGATLLVIADSDRDENGREVNAGVFRVPASGGAPKRIATVPRLAWDLAKDEQSIFVIAEQVLRIPKTGGQPQIVSGAREDGNEIAVGRDDVFFVSSDLDTLAGLLWKVPKRGTPPDAGAIPIAVDAGSVRAIATDGSRPFWILADRRAATEDATLEMQDRNGTTVRLANARAWSGLAVYRSRIYWSTPEGVKSLPLPR